MGANNSSITRLSSRSSGDHAVFGTNNLPPITFHSTHGENVRIMNNGAIAKRTESFCKGIAFSNRPIKVNEKVYLKFSETSTSWSGVLRFGFTSVDPSLNRGGLPKYACPDFTNKPGYWAKALPERYAKHDTVLFYYVTANGDVHFGINGEEKGVFFSGVDTRNPLWTLLDIYGNTVAMEFLDPRTQENQLNSSHRSMSLPSGVNAPHMQHSSSLDGRQTQHRVAPSVLTVRYNAGLPIQGLKFHSTHGSNVRLSNDHKIAIRDDAEFSRGYVFVERPVRPNERVIIQILHTERVYVGSLAFGLTTCDPATLSSSELPEDSTLLLDRPEYWVVHEDVATSPERGDELGFCISPTGEVLFYKNRSKPIVIMHVDQTQRLWAFFDVYGTTVKIKLLGVTTASGFPNSGERGDDVNLSPLRVMLPPTGGSNCQEGSLSSLSSENQRISLNNETFYDSTVVDGEEGVADNASNECAVCYEKAVDCVLYACGHMCMCYDCAHQLWQRPGGATCPICRAEIRDVIRTFRS